MTAVLRFLFARRFNRFDTLSVGLASGFFAFSDARTAIILILVCAFVSACGEEWLERRS